MEALLAKMESIIENCVKELEEKPIRGSMRLLIYYFVFKTIYTGFKKI